MVDLDGDEAWRLDYNTGRPHTSLDGLTPTEFATRKEGECAWAGKGVQAASFLGFLGLEWSATIKMRRERFPWIYGRQQ